MMKPENIVMMEDHDKAYNAWKERGIRERTLVHVDAHIDFGWVPDTDLDEIGTDTIFLGSACGKMVSVPNFLLNPFTKSRKKMVNIGNYICPAMREGMVKKFYWIVPDASFHSRKGRQHIIKQLNTLLKIKSPIQTIHDPRSTIHDDRITCRLLGREVIVCGLEGLERIDEPVLLDIDVDFMLTRHIWDDLDPARTPWIFPEELSKKLTAKIGNIDVLTISYSVEGGFTPLEFKHLGDELRMLFDGSLSEEKRMVMRYKKEALLCKKGNKSMEAASLYEDALRVDDRDASAYFNLCLLNLGTDIAKARACYDKAVSIDKTYGTAYNNRGIMYLYKNRLKAAEAEYKNFLRLGADNTAALNGLAHVALAGRRYSEADRLFERCLCTDAKHPEARFGKAIAAFKAGRLDDALKIFSGLKNDIPDGQEIYWWLGRIAERKGEIGLAIDDYKNAVMRGGDGPLVHLILARLYIAKGLHYRALEELERAFKMLKSSWWPW